MNTNMTGFKWFSKSFASSCYVRNSPSIGKVIKELLNLAALKINVSGALLHFK